MSPPKTLWTAEEIAASAFRFVHPLEDEAEVAITALSRFAGFSRTGINHITVAPGKHAFPFHRHLVEEEWVYILSGTAEIRIGEETHALSAGGFCAFPPGGEAHWVANPGPEELHCLTGGESREAETVDFPDHGKRLTRSPAGAEMQPIAGEPFDFFSKTPLPGKGS